MLPKMQLTRSARPAFQKTMHTLNASLSFLAAIGHLLNGVAFGKRLKEFPVWQKEYIETKAS